MRISRQEKSRFTAWWFTADHALFAAAATLILAGLVLSLAASPAAAERKGLTAFFFVERHFKFALLSLAVLWLVPLFSAQELRRLALALFVGAFAAMIAVLFVGPEINGARRWLVLGGVSFQPSEFMKPAFIVLSAWLLAEARKHPNMPALPLAFTLLVAVCGLLVLEPDFGQAFLLAAAWCAMFFISGQPLSRVVALGLCGLAGVAAAYASLAHVRGRFDRFLHPPGGGTSQTEHALRSFVDGGLWGRGPGEGMVKAVLPDAHTDFVFAVMAEEFGAVACLLTVLLFAFMVVRAFAHARRQECPANSLTITGLALLFGGQALINMAVNVGLLPAKGITLPFVSAGGSSLLAAAITVGMMIGFSRRLALPEIAAPRPPGHVPGDGGALSSGAAETELHH